MSVLKSLTAFLVLLVYLQIFLQDTVCADCDICDLSRDGDAVDLLKNSALSNWRSSYDSEHLFQLLKEKYGQGNFADYETIINAFVDRKIKDHENNATMTILEKVLQFLGSTCKKRSEKSSVSEKQAYLEELINDIVSSKLAHLVNSTADKINGMQKNLDQNMKKLQSSSVGVLADEQREDDVKNFEIDFQTSEQPQQAALRKFNRLYQLLRVKNLPQAVTLLATGTYYYHIASALPWKDSKIFCEKYGMELAALATKEELETVIRAIPVTHKASCFYTAGSDLVARPGIYFWVNGRREEVNASLWYPTKPNAYIIGKEACIYVRQTEGYYISDTQCTTACHIICKTTPYT